LDRKHRKRNDSDPTDAVLRQARCELPRRDSACKKSIEIFGQHTVATNTDSVFDEVGNCERRGIERIRQENVGTEGLRRRVRSMSNRGHIEGAEKRRDDTSM
jgi:hypothetical protein